MLELCVVSEISEWGTFLLIRHIFHQAAVSENMSFKSGYSFAHRVASEGRLIGIFSGWGSPRVLIAKYSGDSDVSMIYDTSQPFCQSSSSLDKPNNQHEMAPTSTMKTVTAQLGILPSVAIAGCDLMGSCLYTAGVCASNSGKVRIAQTHLDFIFTFNSRFASITACPNRSFNRRCHAVLFQRCLL